MTRLIAGLLALVVSGAAYAEKIGGVCINSAASKLCPAAAYDNSAQGAWVDGNKPTLAFRISCDSKGAGCYACLNSVPDLNIVAAGSGPGTVRKAGKNMLFENDFIGVRFNLSTKGAQYQRKGNSGKTLGILDD